MPVREPVPAVDNEGDEAPAAAAPPATQGGAPESTAATTQSLLDDVPSMTVTVLKEHLKTFALPVSGRKAELADRLASALQSKVFGRNRRVNGICG